MGPDLDAGEHVHEGHQLGAADDGAQGAVRGDVEQHGEELVVHRLDPLLVEVDDVVQHHHEEIDEVALELTRRCASPGGGEGGSPMDEPPRRVLFWLIP